MRSLSGAGRRRRSAVRHRAGRRRPRAGRCGCSGCRVSRAVTEVRACARIWSKVPESTMTPSRMMLIRSARASTSVRMWLESRIEGPGLLGRDLVLEDGLHQWVQPEVGSSRTSSSTSEASAATMATFCRLPLEWLRPFFVGSARSARAGGRAGPRRGHAERAEQVDRLPAGHPRPQGHIAGDIRQPAVQRHGIPPGSPPRRLTEPPSARSSRGPPGSRSTCRRHWGRAARAPHRRVPAGRARSVP